MEDTKGGCRNGSGEESRRTEAKGERREGYAWEKAGNGAAGGASPAALDDRGVCAYNRFNSTVGTVRPYTLHNRKFTMEKDLEKAISLLGEEYTCVLCRGEEVLTTVARGVRPLLQWLDGGVEPGFSAADRVVGRGAAFLYRLLGVRAVYARVMSEPAVRVLEEGGITALPDRVVPGIVNRTGDGPCPFEAAVLHITEPGEALRAIREKMAALALRSGK